MNRVVVGIVLGIIGSIGTGCEWAFRNGGVHTEAPKEEPQAAREAPQDVPETPKTTLVVTPVERIAGGFPVPLVYLRWKNGHRSGEFRIADFTVENPTDEPVVLAIQWLEQPRFLTTVEYRIPGAAAPEEHAIPQDSGAKTRFNFRVAGSPPREEWATMAPKEWKRVEIPAHATVEVDQEPVDWDFVLSADHAAADGSLAPLNARVTNLRYAMTFLRAFAVEDANGARIPVVFGNEERSLELTWAP